MNVPIDTINSFVSMHAQQVSFIKFPGIEVDSVELNINDQNTRLFIGEQINGPDLPTDKLHPVNEQKYIYDSNISSKFKKKLTYYWYKVNGLFKETDKLSVTINYKEDSTQQIHTISTNIDEASDKDSLVTTLIAILALIISYKKITLAEIILLCFYQKSQTKIFLYILFAIRSSNFDELSSYCATFALSFLFPPLGVLIILFSVVMRQYNIGNFISICSIMIISSFNHKSILPIGLLLYLISDLYKSSTDYLQSKTKEQITNILRNSVSLLLLLVVAIFVYNGSASGLNSYIFSKNDDIINPHFAPFSSERLMFPDLAKAAADALKQTKDWSLCPLCKNPRPVEVHSTERDLIIIFATFESYRAVVPVRTIRTTGCRAKILLIVDETTAVPKMFQDCGCTVLSMVMPKSATLNQRRGMRYPILRDLCPLIMNDFDRVLYMDGYDTVFQQDPFPATIIPNQLHYSPENHTYKTNHVLRDWRATAPHLNDMWRVFDDEEVICGGLFMGDIRTMWRTGLMESAFFYRDFDYLCDDQTFLEYIIHNGIYKAHNIKTYRDRELASILWSKDGYTKAGLGYIKQVGTDWYPKIVHQAMNVYDWRELIWQSCRDDPKPVEDDD